jgi:hypothetical protein
VLAETSPPTGPAAAVAVAPNLNLSLSNSRTSFRFSKTITISLEDPRAEIRNCPAETQERRGAPAVCRPASHKSLAIFPSHREGCLLFTGNDGNTPGRMQQLARNGVIWRSPLWIERPRPSAESWLRLGAGRTLMTSPRKLKHRQQRTSKNDRDSFHCNHLDFP